MFLGPHDFLNRALDEERPDGVTAPDIGVDTPEGKLGLDGEAGTAAEVMVESRDDERLLAGLRKNFFVNEGERVFVSERTGVFMTDDAVGVACESDSSGLGGVKLVVAWGWEIDWRIRDIDGRSSSSSSDISSSSELSPSSSNSGPPW